MVSRKLIGIVEITDKIGKVTASIPFW